MPKQELHIIHVNTLKTKEGKAFECAKFHTSSIDRTIIIKMRGRIEGDPQEYWWDQQGRCTINRPRSPHATRRQDYDLDYSQLTV